MGEPNIEGRKPQSNDELKEKLHLIMLDIANYNNKHHYLKTKKGVTGKLNPELKAINDKIRAIMDDL